MASSPTKVRAPEASEFPSLDEAVRFFQESGFLYQTIPKIGELVASLGPEAHTTDGFDKHFKETAFCHQYLRHVLEPYTRTPSAFSFLLGCDPVRYFALTVDSSVPQYQGHPIAVYVWGRNSELECAKGSQAGNFTAKEWANQLFYIPYPQIKGNFSEIHATLKEGGIIVAHPRLAFIVKSGTSIGYVWEASPVNK
ncbi:hypothetical protein F5Y08DRAFT_205609 [Xylaria arbuscula]|uniref:Uncharacterized protein n=1 Tax=Xylaria arbuscula TaxID=114810 RepID=A0A9W8N8T2_9PEZI|nr:hypothetical protein F5Y08DRAFT_205609 [Xylaria arbuscula]KAJ3563693.1 hypothetical protein NPX13_g8107 [Xylaria arbuscula]